MSKENTTEKVEKQEHKSIYAALAAFQGELKPIPKTKKVSFEARNGTKVEYSYAPLGEIMETIYPLLAKHGLSVRHEIVRENSKDAMVAILTHETATEVESKGEEVVKKPDGETITTNTTSVRLTGELRSGPVQISQGGEMKDTGIAITYARRYSITMLLGIATEEDVDVALELESAQNAVKFAEGRAKKGLDDAKDEKALDKAIKILKDDMALLEKGKAPALGLKKEQYESLLAHAEVRRKQILAAPTVEKDKDAQDK